MKFVDDLSTTILVFADMSVADDWIVNVQLATLFTGSLQDLLALI
jgi:hypothetical protein